MSPWHFRALVRAFREEHLGYRCPLGVGLVVVCGDEARAHPTAAAAGECLGLSVSFAYGVANGWDCGGGLYCNDDESKAGHRYGRRLKRIHRLRYLERRDM